MIRQFLTGLASMDLPLLAMGIFVAFFLAVLLRVSQRARANEYRRMASLPLTDDAERSN